MALEIALKAKKLVQDVNDWNEQVVAAVGGNKSANKRARTTSVEIRERFKNLRVDLLNLEKKKK